MTPAYPIRSLVVSVRWNPDAERPAAAALAAFFARCEIARALCGVSRVYLVCVSVLVTRRSLSPIVNAGVVVIDALARSRMRV